MVTGSGKLRKVNIFIEVTDKQLHIFCIASEGPKWACSFKNVQISGVRKHCLILLRVPSCGKNWNLQFYEIHACRNNKICNM